MSLSGTSYFCLFDFPRVKKIAFIFFILENICESFCSKVRSAIETEVPIFNFNLSTSERETLKCHLELSVPSSLYGFVVFIEEMSLESSVVGCQTDFVQFGRDIL